MLGHRPPVQLGGPPGAGAGPPGRAGEGDLDQSRLGKPVEVERGQRAADAGGRRGFGPADPAPLRRDVVVEAAPHRVLKSRDDADLGHGDNSKTNQL